MVIATLRLTALLLIAIFPNAAAAEPPPMKVFVLAGQSNMAGPAVVDLKGKDYNGGRGTLVSLFDDPVKAPIVAHLRKPDGSWRIRDDVSVRCTPVDVPGAVGPLDGGCTPLQGRNLCGPELRWGDVLG
ncbi:MAG: hypothetical protein ACT4PL_01350, partial [Phycisphaerales bacterium]